MVLGTSNVWAHPGLNRRTRRRWVPLARPRRQSGVDGIQGATAMPAHRADSAWSETVFVSGESPA
ncbi:hypothetical protein, partial [Mycobacterium tuberculosis]|uniref:hypothetical protein n=1 Tax=Mycobacterium tuberculosis TaxID=1773 RepID=UPI001BDE07F0